MLCTTQTLPLRVVTRHTDFAADIVARFAPWHLCGRGRRNLTRGSGVGGPSAREEKPSIEASILAARTSQELTKNAQTFKVFVTVVSSWQGF